MVSFLIEGYVPKDDEHTWCDKVLFHGHIDSGQKRFLGSVVLEGERDALLKKAAELIDKALTKLIFAFGMDLRLNGSDYYLTPVNSANQPAIPRISKENGTIHRVTASFVTKYRIGENRTKILLLDIPITSAKGERGLR
jgi:hypothetical protein